MFFCCCGPFLLLPVSLVLSTVLCYPLRASRVCFLRPVWLHNLSAGPEQNGNNTVVESMVLFLAPAPPALFRCVAITKPESLCSCWLSNPTVPHPRNPEAPKYEKPKRLYRSLKQLKFCCALALRNIFILWYAPKPNSNVEGPPPYYNDPKPVTPRAFK